VALSLDASWDFGSCLVVQFFYSVKIKLADNFFATFNKSCARLNREANMKKTNRKSNLLDIDVKVNVKMGKKIRINNWGGGGQTFI
jgi:hypothetical protein